MTFETGRIEPIRSAFILSISLHLALYFVYGRLRPEKEEDLSQYRVVQLLDFAIPASPPPAAVRPPKAEGEIAVSETNAVPEEEKKEVPAPSVDDYSGYMPFFKVARLPEFIKKARPEYPARARLMNIEAEVLAEGYIDETGLMRKVVIIRSGGEDFDRAVSEALYRSEFRPAVSRENKPVPVRVRIPYRFELE